MKKNFLLALSTTFIALVIVEAFLQIKYYRPKTFEEPKTNWAIVPERTWTEYHPVLGWYHQKNKKAFLKKNKNTINVEINTNSLGLRGKRDYAKEKPNGIVRILVLGDSFAFGWGVKDEETFPAVWEARHQNIEVPNLSVAGYGIDQMLMGYRTIGKDLKPDYVLISIFPEDFWRATRAFADTGHAKPYFSISRESKLILHNVPTPPKFSLRYNQFPDLIEYNYLENFLLKSQLYRLLKRFVLAFAKRFGLVDCDSTIEWMVGRAILSKLIGEIREMNAVPLILIVPPETWLREDKATSLQKSMMKVGKRKNVAVIDLTPFFVQAAKEHGLNRYYLEQDHHWSAEGHKLVADFTENKWPIIFRKIQQT